MNQGIAAGSTAPRATLEARTPVAGRRRQALADILTLPGFVRISAGNGLVQAGQRLQNLTIAWLILEMTNSALWMGAIIGLPAFSVVVFSMVGGVLADSPHLRRSIRVTRLALAGALLSAAALALGGVLQPAHLLAIAFVTVAATAADLPMGRTVLFEVVGRARLLPATAASSILLSLFNVAGPALLGVIVAGFGAGSALLVLAALFCLAAALGPRRRDFEPAAQSGRHGNPAHELVEGLRYLHANPGVAWLVALGFLVPLAGMYFALVPVYARDVLGAGADGVGLLVAAYGLGNLSGSLFLTLRGGLRRRGAWLAVLGFAYPCGIVLFSLSGRFEVAALVCLAMGAVAVMWQTILSSTVQSTAAAEVKGRVMSVYTMGLQLLSLGFLLGGGLASFAGTVGALLVAGLGFAGFNALAFYRSKDLRRID